MSFSDRALELGRSAGDVNAELVHYGQGLLRAVDLGQAGEVLPLLRNATEFQQILSIAAGTGLCAALAADHELALATLERFAGSGFDGLPRGADWLAPLAFLAHTCAIVAAPKHARWLNDALRSQPATAVRVGPLVGWWGPVDHHLGSLCRLLGQPEEANNRLDHALAIEERMGARPFAVRTRAELARVARLTNNNDGDGRARVLMEEAVALAESLGTTGIAAEVLSR